MSWHEIPTFLLFYVYNLLPPCKLNRILAVVLTVNGNSLFDVFYTLYFSFCFSARWKWSNIAMELDILNKNALSR